MKNISLSLASFSDAAPVQEAKNPIEEVVTHATTTSIPQAALQRQRLPVAMPSMQVSLLQQLEATPSQQPREKSVPHAATGHSPVLSAAKLNTMLATAFDALRLEINTQAGPSHHPHLNALDQLQQRGFKPSPGGMQIPLTANSLLGGGCGGAGGSKRVSGYGAISGNIHLVPTAAGAELRREIARKQVLFDTLKLQLVGAEEENDAEEIARLTSKVNEARTEILILNDRMNLLIDAFQRMNK